MVLTIANPHHDQPLITPHRRSPLVSHTVGSSGEHWQRRAELAKQLGRVLKDLAAERVHLLMRWLLRRRQSPVDATCASGGSCQG